MIIKKRFLIGAGFFLFIGLTLFVLSSLVTSSSHPRRILGSHDCPGYHYSTVVDAPLFAKLFGGYSKEIKCLKNTTDPAIYKQSVLVQLDSRFFELPLGYAGKDMPDFIAERPQNFLKTYYVTSVYSEMSPGFPYFYERQRGVHSDKKIDIQFYLANECDPSRQHCISMSKQEDFERYVEWNTKKDQKNNSEEDSLFDFKGYKRTPGNWYFKRDESAKVSYILSCDNPYANHRPSICNVTFIHQASGLGFKISFPKVLVEEWEEIKNKSVALITGFERVQDE